MSRPAEAARDKIVDRTSLCIGRTIDMSSPGPQTGTSGRGSSTRARRLSPEKVGWLAWHCNSSKSLTRLSVPIQGLESRKILVADATSCRRIFFFLKKKDKRSKEEEREVRLYPFVASQFDSFFLSFPSPPTWYLKLYLELQLV